MKMRVQQIPAGMLLLMLAMALLPGFLHTSQRADPPSVQTDLFIIASEDIPETAISPDIAGQLFLGKRKTISGRAVARIAVPEVGQAHKTLLEQIVKRSDAHFRSHWKRLVFTGQASMPVFLESEDAVKQYVRTHRSSIGIVSSRGGLSGLRVIPIHLRQ